jgi:outer membrane PBP1 activator LpoA protein
VCRSLVVLLAFLIAGCSTHSPEADAQAQAQAEADAASKDSAKCQSYGLQPGTKEFEKCLAQLADKRAQEEAGDRSSMANRLQGRPPSWAGGRP